MATVLLHFAAGALGALAVFLVFLRLSGATSFSPPFGVVVIGIAGGTGFKYTTSDVCDGVAQGHDGMNYPLASREFIAGMIEIYANTHMFDGAILMSSCDKGLPACLVAAARMKDTMPVVVIPGGSNEPGPCYMMEGDVGKGFGQVQAKMLDPHDFEFIVDHTLPCNGACQFMGTASTMQVMSEALGMAPPTAALAPSKRVHASARPSCTGAVRMASREGLACPSASGATPAPGSTGMAVTRSAKSARSTSTALCSRI